MDKIPQMTERKKKIEMHVQIATKILSEIKRRGIDILQDFEDEIMTSGKVSSTNRNKMNEYFSSQFKSNEEFEDRMRLLVI